MTEIKTELVERMALHLRDMAVDNPLRDVGNKKINAQLKELHAIVAELPEPVDADLLLAREVGGEVDWPSYADKRAEYMRGMGDKQPSVVAALAAIRRVRAEQQPARATTWQEEH